MKLPEELGHEVVTVLVALVELAAMTVIFAGALQAAARVGRAALHPAGQGAGGAGQPAVRLARIRLDLGRWLALGLEFQLASDLLRTAVSPSFRGIGQLAAVASIRTALNYFLGREIRDEHAEVVAREATDRAVRTSPPPA